MLSTQRDTFSSKIILFSSKYREYCLILLYSRIVRYSSGGGKPALFLFFFFLKKKIAVCLLDRV